MSMEVACLVYLRSIGMNMGNGGVGDGQSPTPKDWRGL